MKKIFFLIHDLGQGGAEKVLVNLVNNMDRSKFDISVTVLFGGGVNEQFLAPDIHFHTVFPKEVPGNSKLMKLLTPAQLHRRCVKEHYDIEVSYLEGPSARVLSGCQSKDTKLVCWIHSTISNIENAASSFRSIQEAQTCYGRFNQIVCVSKCIKQNFLRVFPEQSDLIVLYNTIESQKILEQSGLPIPDGLFRINEFKIIAVGSMKAVKAFDRLIRIHDRLRRSGYPVHTYFLGIGPDLEKLQNQVALLNQNNSITFLGYETNPYRYVAKSDLFVCCSLSEGFSTAATEALIVGTPVCTVEVSGMEEMLGEHNEWGIVTENNEEALYQGIKDLLCHPDKLAHYKEKAIERGKAFSTKETVCAVEKFFETLVEENKK